MRTPVPDQNIAFLAGGGEMGAMMRQHDWSTSPVGPPDGWPQSLRSAVGLMLANKHIMFVAWGPDLAFLYNDAYRPVFGKKHPWALGRPFREIWSEVWDDVEPLVNAALGGEATWSENLHLVLERNGYPEDCWFTFSYSPVRDEDGKVAGIFCAASETTDTVLTERRLKDQAARQKQLFQKAPGFIAVLSGPDHVFEFVNDAYVQLAGERDSLGRSVREVFPEIESQGLYDVLDNVYATGERFVAERLAVTLRDAPDQLNREVVLDFVYEPISNEAGDVTGIFLEGHDVTESHRTQVALRESEERYQALFAASPVPFMVLAPDAPDFTIVAANDALLAATLTTRESLVGHRVFDVFPDDGSRPGQLGSEAFATSLDQVMTTRTANAMERVRYDIVMHDGEFEPHWWEAINAPMLDASGEVSAIIHQVTRVTEQYYREEAELEEQKRQSFLLNLSDALRAEKTAEAMTDRALRMLFEHMRLDRCYVGVYLLTEDLGEFPHQVHADCLPPLPSHVRLSDFPEALRRSFDRTLVVDDVTKMEELSDSDRVNLDALSLRALIAATLRKGEGVPLWSIVVASTSPRVWTQSEVGLVEEVAERTWAAAERARAETHIHQLNETLEERVAERTAERDRLWRNSQDMLVVTTTDGTFIAINKAFRDTLGREEHELVGLNFVELIHPEDFAAASAILENIVETPLTKPYEHRLRRKDGEYRWTSWTAAYENGHIFANGRDVTDERALAAELAHRTSVQNRVWSTSRGLLMIADLDGAFRAVNPAWTRTLGYTEAETIGRSYRDFIVQDDIPSTEEATVVAASGIDVDGFENCYRHKDGSTRCIAWNTSVEGGLIYAFGRDVTDERAREAEMQVLAEQLRQAQKMEAMGQLTGGVAHDFNNLLTPIIGTLDILVHRGLGSERERRLIDGAMQSADRAKILVQRLLAFARRQPLQPVAVDILRLVEGMVGLISSTLGPTIDMRVVIDPDLPPANTDPNQLEMALLNLAVNARDAMPDGGELTIKAKRATARQGYASNLEAGDYVLLCVMDTGAGMDEVTRERAIEPFFSTKGIGKGTGLGLSMVHGLLAQLGGRMTIDSAPGKGTAIELWLPISTTAIGVEETDAPAPATQLGRGVALLVDDEELVRMSTADMLIDLGFEVVEARSAEEALNMLNNGTIPTLLITDHLMPGMSGVDLAREARLIEPALPVLIVSGYAEEDGIAADLPRLTKPFRNAELAESISALIPIAE